MKAFSALLILFFSLTAFAVQHDFPDEITGYADVLNAGKIIVTGVYDGSAGEALALRRAKENAESRLRQVLYDLPVSRLRTVEDTILFDGLMSYVTDAVLTSAVSCGERGYYDKEELKAYYCLSADISPLEAFTDKYAAAPPEKSDNAASDYDAVIMNTAGLPFVPAFLNKIYGADGTELWSRRQGSPLYAPAVADAFNILFLEGKRSPLNIEAIRVDSYTDVYLGSGDTEELKELIAAGEPFRLIFTFIK